MWGRQTSFQEMNSKTALDAIRQNENRKCGRSSKGSFWTLNGRAWSGQDQVLNESETSVLPWDVPARLLNFSRGKPFTERVVLHGLGGFLLTRLKPTEIISVTFIARLLLHEIVHATSFYDLQEFHLMTEPTLSNRL
jgi:hypothetical protein